MATAVKRQVRILHLLCQFSSRDSLFLFVKVNYLRFVGNPYLTGLRGLPVTLDPSLRTSYVMTESGANRLVSLCGGQRIEMEETKERGYAS